METISFNVLLFFSLLLEELAPSARVATVTVNDDVILVGLFFVLKLVGDVLERDDFHLVFLTLEDPVAGCLLTVPAVIQRDELFTFWIFLSGSGGVLDLLKDRIPPHY